MSVTITHSQPDLILKRFDKNTILEHQGQTLANYIPGWSFYQPIPNQSFIVRGGYPIGSYCKIFSPVFDNATTDYNTEIQKVYDGVEKFIQDLNKQGKTVSRIECWLDQSDDVLAIPHPANDNGDMVNRYQNNQDYKNAGWIFNDIFKTENTVKETVYGNKFVRQVNKFKPTKKYYTLRIESSWLSI
jgi:hypothetical protein